MDDSQIKALLAGVFFGLWPLFMNRSGLSGNVSAFAFSALVAVFVFPFAVGGLGHLTNIRWLMVIAAGLLGAIGVMCFNGMLAKATAQNVSTLFVLMIVVQTAIPAIYQVIVNGGASPTKCLGFAFAAIAAILLLKS
jgi:hypothetical protein